MYEALSCNHSTMETGICRHGYQLPLISIMLIFVKNYIFKGETELGLIVMILIASFSLVLKN